jgi:hypothetical protein
MSGVPPDSNSLAGFPLGDALTHGVYDSNDFMTRNSRILKTRK